MGCHLSVGDTVKGPLCITIQILGLAAQGRTLLRSTAKVGDEIYVTGTLVCAAAAVDRFPSKDKPLFCSFAKPSARVNEGLDLVGPGHLCH